MLFVDDWDDRVRDLRSSGAAPSGTQRHPTNHGVDTDETTNKMYGGGQMISVARHWVDGLDVSLLVTGS
jgi:hypothetical protein